MLNQLQKYAPLLIRLCLAAIFMTHGSQKLFGLFGGHGLTGAATSFAGLGFKPAMFWAVVAGLIEFACGLSMLLGFLTRYAGVLLSVFMCVAIYKVHWKDGFFGFEYQLLIIASALSLVAGGPGALALDSIRRKKSIFG